MRRSPRLHTGAGTVSQRSQPLLRSISSIPDVYEPSDVGSSTLLTLNHCILFSSLLPLPPLGRPSPSGSRSGESPSAHSSPSPFLTTDLLPAPPSPITLSYPHAPYFNPRSPAFLPAAISHKPACLSLPPSKACPPLAAVLGRPSLPRV